MRRIDWFDVVARATGDLDRAGLARAVEAMNRAYREGAPAPHARSRFQRAAYLVHLLPALVCDQRNLFTGPLADLLDRPRVRVLALGGGPGTEVLALAEAAARLRTSRDLTLERLSVTRVDNLPAWDDTFLPLRERFLEAFAHLDSGLGETWHLDTPAPLLAADLTSSPLPEPVLDAARESDLVLLPNLLTELLPRATPELPEAFLANLSCLVEAMPAGSSLLVVDRGKAPGAPQRAGQVLDRVAGSRPGSELVGPHRTQGRCSCRPSRTLRQLYRQQVSLATTRREDAPLFDLHTLWASARFRD